MNRKPYSKYYSEPSVFLPENLLRESRRQKRKLECDVPDICLLDPDGDLAEYLLIRGEATKDECWACYHSSMYNFRLGNHTIGIIPCIVGSSYAVLVAEQLFVSGCKVLISVTSAGIITEKVHTRKFALITSSIRDEGTSYHYLPPERPSVLNPELFKLFHSREHITDCPYFQGISWTTDAPYRETASAIREMKNLDVICVEMEAAALYALSEAKKYNIICLAHLTNSMAQSVGDFEKGEEMGSIDTLNLLNYILRTLQTYNII